MDIQSEKETVADLKMNRLLIFCPGPKMKLAQAETFPNNILGKIAKMKGMQANIRKLVRLK